MEPQGAEPYEIEACIDGTLDRIGLEFEDNAAADDDAPMKTLSWITARRAISQAG